MARAFRTPSTTVVANLDAVLGPQVDDHNKTYVMQGSPQMRALIRAGRELAGHRPLDELFQVIMDLSVEAVCAGRGVLMTLEDGELQVRAASRRRVQNFEHRPRPRAERKSVAAGARRANGPGAARAHEHRGAEGPQHDRGALQTNDRVIGLIYVDSPHLIREFSREDLNLLTVMANVAAIRIEHARLNEIEEAERAMAKDMEQAALIQKGLLPRSRRPSPDMDIAGKTTACRTVGGDYFDFLDVPRRPRRIAGGRRSGQGHAGFAC